MSAHVDGIPARNSNRISSLTNVTLGDIRGEAAAIALLIPLLLAPIFWNGFPLIYYDTGAYVLEGLGGHFMVERSPVYSLFLHYAGAGASLWFIALIQAATTAYVVTQCARAEIPQLKLVTLLLMVAFLVIATGLPWYVGQIEPDCFTALVVLAIYLLALRADRLGRTRAFILAGVGGFATAVHPSHLVLAGFLLILIVAMRAVVGIARRWPKPRLLEPAVVFILGLALIVSANFQFTRQIFVSRAGQSFVFARMLQDGIVMRLLDDTCPKSGYTLCAYRNSLPPTADGWLWTPDSPFFKLGHFEGTAADSARIVSDAMLRYPSLQLEFAARDAATQFIRFRTGDQIEPQEWVLYPVLARYLPGQMRAYLAARQQRGQIDFRIIGYLHVVVGALSLIGLGMFLGFAISKRRHDEGMALPGFVLAALVGNAIICGVLSGPHDRYQSRLIWMAPFALMMSLRPSWPPTRSY